VRWYVGSDHGGVALRRQLVEHLRARGHEVVVELGPDDPTESIDYPDVARQVCERVLAEPGARGLLVCGSGQGMAMAANRRPGIRAAVVSDPYSARMARAHNDANVVCMGGRVVGPGLAADVLDAFADAAFEGGRHTRRVDKIEAIGTPTPPAAGLPLDDPPPRVRS
jgi:ribose 5-phosphate isomerase B